MFGGRVCHDFCLCLESYCRLHTIDSPDSGRVHSEVGKSFVAKENSRFSRDGIDAQLFFHRNSLRLASFLTEFGWTEICQFWWTFINLIGRSDAV